MPKQMSSEKLTGRSSQLDAQAPGNRVLGEEEGSDDDPGRRLRPKKKTAASRPGSDPDPGRRATRKGKSAGAAITRGRSRKKV